MDVRKRVWLGIALLQATPALGFGPGGGGAYSGFGGSGSGSGSFSGGFGGGGGFGDGADGYLGFDVDAAERRRTAHGILAAVAFVLLFPLGAVALRVLPSSSGRLGFWAHVGAQMAGWVVYIVAAVLGILLVKEVNIPGEGSLMLNPNIAYHPIIGVVLLALVAFQPLLGYLHHRRYRRTQRRGAASHLHLWNGRVLIVLGIVNGGLGLHVSGAPSSAKVGYAIVAAVLGGGWLVTGLVCWGVRSRSGSGSGSGSGRPRGKGTRMERIDKAVRAEEGGRGPERATYA